MLKSPKFVLSRSRQRNALFRTGLSFSFLQLEWFPLIQLGQSSNYLVSVASVKIAILEFEIVQAEMLISESM